jgi:hypothetical protein
MSLDTAALAPTVSTKNTGVEVLSNNLMEERFQAEIDRLHDFFVQWFTGTIDNDELAFASKVQDSMHPNFHLINPQGVLTPRAPLLQALRQAYGCRKDQVFRIECRNVHQVKQAVVGTNTYLVTYQEWQQVGPETTQTARLVSAWFQLSNDRLKWKHVHETWMPGRSPPSESQMWSADRS